MVEAALDKLIWPDEVEASRRVRRRDPCSAVAGRLPNVGKSTLINAWLGEERLVAEFDLPGTTRDAIRCRSSANGQKFRADRHRRPGRKGRVFEAIEKFSGRQDVAGDRERMSLLLLDATEGVTDQDAHIAGYRSRGPRRGAGGQQVGCDRRCQRETPAALDREPARLPRSRRCI